MRYIILILAGLYGQVSTSQDCPYTFTGKITDLHDGLPIHGATIYLKELNLYTTSDRVGKFMFSELCNGKITLVISHIGCVTKEEIISIKSDLYRKISLEHHLESLEEVTVKTKPNHALEREKKIKQKVLESYSSGQLGDALKEVSGVNTLNTGNTIVKPVINGMHSSRILIMNDGVRMQDQEWGIEHAPNVDLNSSESITVIKGASALAYGGDAIGGVVIMSPQRMYLKDSIFGKTIVSGQQNGRGFSVSSSLNKSYKNGWYLAGQASYKKMGDFKAPDYYLTNSGMEAKAFNLRTGYKNVANGFDFTYSFIENEIGILSAAHIGSIEDLVNAIESPKPIIEEDFSYDINAPKQQVQHHLLKVDFYKRFEGLGKFNIQYDFQHNQRLEFDKRVGDDRDKAALDLTLKTHTIAANFKFDADNERIFNTGLLYRYQENYPDPETGVRRLIPDYIKFDAGAFVTGAWDVNEKLHFDAGLRYDFNRIDAKKFYRKSDWEALDYDRDFDEFVLEELETQLLTQPVLDFHNISTAAGIAYQFEKESIFYFNYNLSNRAPNPSELFSDGLHHSAARIELGNLRLKRETAHRFSGAYHHSNSWISTQFEVYYSLINNYILATPGEAQQTIRGAFPVWKYDQTNAAIVGADFSMNLQLNSQFAFVNKSSWIQGKSKLTKMYLIDMPASRTENTLIFKREKWHDFQAGLTSEWVFSKKNFPDNNFEQFIPTTQTVVLVDISTPPKAYHLMHLKSEMSFDWSTSTVLTVGVNVQNIFNVSHRDYLNRLRFFADDLGRNISLQLKLKY